MTANQIMHRGRMTRRHFVTWLGVAYAFGRGKPQQVDVSVYGEALFDKATYASARQRPPKRKPR